MVSRFKSRPFIWMAFLFVLNITLMYCLLKKHCYICLTLKHNSMTKHKLDFFIPEKRVVVQEKRKVTIELESKEYIGKKLGQLRKERKINQVVLCKSIGITRTSLSNIESGRQALSLKILEKICIALKIKSNEILPF